MGRGKGWERGVKRLTGTICIVWEEGWGETDGKNVSQGMVFHNPGKKGWSFCHSDITFTLGLVDVKSLDFLSGVDAL
jgi:hypothetical protein